MNYLKTGWKYFLKYYDHIFWICMIVMLGWIGYGWIFRTEQTLEKVKSQWDKGYTQIALALWFIVWVAIIIGVMWHRKRDSTVLDAMMKDFSFTLEDFNKPVSGNEYIDYYIAYCDKYDRDSRFEWSTKQKLTFQEYVAESLEWPGTPRDYCSGRKTDLFISSPCGARTRVQFG